MLTCQRADTHVIFFLPAAHHHQSEVETSGGAGAGEEPHQVKHKQSACPLISLTESFLHKLACFDSQCAEMLLLHWWGFTRLCRGPARGCPSLVVTDTHAAMKLKKSTKFCIYIEQAPAPTVAISSECTIVSQCERHKL